MKTFLGTMAFALINLFAISQTTKASVSIKVIDSQTKEAVPNATVVLNNAFAAADENGKISFAKISKGNYDLKISSVGYADHLQKINVEQSDITLTISLKSIALFLQPLEVKSLRANNTAPFAKTNFSKEDIARNNIGQDLPIILNQTPSMYVSSDAGNGVGYTYMHIRGSDATRINVTLNGIPYNDAESMGTYFVDLPDFSSSVNSIQIQRGVGTSSNGTGAFGATINLSTNEFNEKSYAELNNSYGSFNTWKNTLKFGSGLIDGHFTIDGRISNITSDGYIDRATSNLRSLAFSTAYINKNTSVRFNIFSGKEKTYQAWYGVPEDSLTIHRTYNPAGIEKAGTPYNNQIDNYWQNHYQLFFNHSFNQKLNFNTAAFLTYGTGYYEEYKADQSFTDYGIPFIGNNTTDLVRQRWLDNYFYGQIFSLQYKNKNDELTVGGGWTRYAGTHFGDVIWSQKYIMVNNFQYYNYPALKTDNNVYAKWQHSFTNHLQSYVDVQYRNVYHRMSGFEGNADLNIARTFNFINPKAGITYHNNGWQLYVSYAMGNKEPNRDDFQASLASQPKAETLHDIELGVEKKQSNYSFGANVYYMIYKDQLVLTGQINDVGSYTRTNVPNSYRLGIEIQGTYVFAKWLNTSANLSFSQNKIQSFTEYIDNWDNGLQNAVQHSNTDISFSPNIIGGATINFIPLKSTTLSLLSKYVSKQYLDNSETDARSLKAFYTEDVKLMYTIKNKIGKEINLIAQVNNVFNSLYLPNGWTYPYIYNHTLYTENGYYPMAGTNFMIAVNIKL